MNPNFKNHHQFYKEFFKISRYVINSIKNYAEK